MGEWESGSGRVGECEWGSGIVGEWESVSGRVGECE